MSGASIACPGCDSPCPLGPYGGRFQEHRCASCGTTYSTVVTVEVVKLGPGVLDDPAEQAEAVRRRSR
jgi:hypothetical protein